MEMTKCKIKREWICQGNSCTMVVGNYLLGHYDEQEDHFDAFTFPGNRGYVTIKIHTIGNEEKDEDHVAKMVEENARLNHHAQLLNYEMSTVDDDMYFHRVTLKINYAFPDDCNTVMIPPAE